MAFTFQYIVPFLVNQCGSVLYYLTLASAGKGCLQVYSYLKSLCFIFKIYAFSMSVYKTKKNSTQIWSIEEIDEIKIKAYELLCIYLEKV